MKGKWKRLGLKMGYALRPTAECPWRVADVHPTGYYAWPSLRIHIDPRTGKPWKSMKAAREWYDFVAKKWKTPNDPAVNARCRACRYYARHHSGGPRNYGTCALEGKPVYWSYLSCVEFKPNTGGE